MTKSCFICHRAAGGFGWFDPPETVGWFNGCRKTEPMNRSTYRRFCSKTCQDIYYELYHWNINVTKTELEQQAIEATLGPLGDYVAIMGLERPLSQYSKAEILGLLNVVFDSYHDTLQTLYKDEIPF